MGGIAGVVPLARPPARLPNANACSQTRRQKESVRPLAMDALRALGAYCGKANKGALAGHATACVLKARDGV